MADIERADYLVQFADDKGRVQEKPYPNTTQEIARAMGAAWCNANNYLFIGAWPIDAVLHTPTREELDALVEVRRRAARRSNAATSVQMALI